MKEEGDGEGEGDVEPYLLGVKGMLEAFEECRRLNRIESRIEITLFLRSERRKGVDA